MPNIQSFSEWAAEEQNKLRIIVGHYEASPAPILEEFLGIEPLDFKGAAERAIDLAARLHNDDLKPDDIARILSASVDYYSDKSESAQHSAQNAGVSKDTFLSTLRRLGLDERKPYQRLDKPEAFWNAKLSEIASKLSEYKTDVETLKDNMNDLGALGLTASLSGLIKYLYDDYEMIMKLLAETFPSSEFEARRSQLHELNNCIQGILSNYRMIRDFGFTSSAEETRKYTTNLVQIYLRSMDIASSRKREFISPQQQKELEGIIASQHEDASGQQAVLFVDNDPSTLLDYLRRFKNESIRILVARSAEEGMQVFNTFASTLKAIVTDKYLGKTADERNMYGINTGYWLLENITRLFEGHPNPIKRIMVSGEGEPRAEYGGLYDLFFRKVGDYMAQVKAVVFGPEPTLTAS